MEFTLNNLINIDSSGMNVPTFVELRSMLISRYKQIYGSDIDLSTGTADGEYVQELSLILNNILQSMKILYGNLDVNNATGEHLEALCALSNVTRKGATNSVASIIFTNTSNNPITLLSAEIMLQDNAGIIWNYNGNENSVTIPANGSITIPVVCSISGSINAPAGWINKLITNINVVIEQRTAAIVGSDTESDSQLRARRNQQNSPVGITVLEALSAALLDVSGIKDVKIYNANSAQISAKDGTTVHLHDIYVILRKVDDALNITDIVGQTIYNKLTPGITTTTTSDADYGVSKTKAIIPTLLGATISSYTETVYWKECKSITPKFTVEYDEIPNRGYDINTGEIIYETIREYLNESVIGTDFNADDILAEVIMSDPKLKGLSTIRNIVVTPPSGMTPAGNDTNPDTFYDYPIFDSSYEDVSSNTHTLTFGGN